MSEKITEKTAEWIILHTGKTGYKFLDDIPQCQIEIIFRAGANKLIHELEKYKAENKELQAVFDLQHTRTQKAEKMWQEATGKHHTLPDLGTLIEWLIDGKYQAYHPDEIEYQRRHRKWALKTAYRWRGMAGIFEAESKLFQSDVECYYKQAEKVETEMKRLNALLAYTGVNSRG